MTALRAPYVVPQLKRVIDMSCVGTVILGGGAGTRLFPLTQTRCKPAISFGGRYRLIDIPMSNALNSGCRKIHIVTQFLSASLHQHILKTYRMEPHTPGYVEILSAEQRPTKDVWYQGTADAIRQNIQYLTESDVDYFLILSGDQLYHMHFPEMVSFAEDTNADLVIAALPIDENDAKRMGVLKTNNRQLIVDFVEKPQTRETLEPLKGPSFSQNSQKKYLGSMGIYLFKRKALLDLLEQDFREDFGKHLIPTQVQKGHSYAYVFQGYWEDIGTIDSFYRANIALTQPQPEFEIYNEKYPIHTAYHCLPPPKISNTQIKQSLICEGSDIRAEKISHSIIGPRSQIGEDTLIDSSYLFGNDHPHSIGSGCEIRKAIIDKNVHIGNNVKLINRQNYHSYENEHLYVRDGILIVTKGSHIPDNFEF